MNTLLIFRILLLSLLVGFVAHRAYYTRKYPPQENDTLSKMPETARTKLAALLSVVALLSSLAFIVYPDLIGFAAAPFPTWLRWMGLLPALGGFALLEWSHRALAANWSDQPRLTSEQTLVQTGPYKSIRHPIYTAFLLILGAPLLLTANWLVGLAWLASSGLDILARIRFEEGVLQERFEEDYTAYREKTGTLLPKL
ncbi:MAG TPA: isoprenylcysteine carboxylmethyltransferase family protein [Anaerolineales bacterium]|nr:isoprenylcysteine carboxylmethyltransferase family protein [Anaerolineales bacterium]